MAKKRPPLESLRNRVVERRRMLGSELTPNPKNFRTHPDEQRDALRGILSEIGQAGELLVYHSERAGGALVLVDGHLRAEDYAGQSWDVAITDLNDAEADKILLAHDPLAAAAGADEEKLEALLREVETDDAGLEQLFDDLAKENDIDLSDGEKEPEDEVELKPEFSVLVKCQNELEQKAVLAELDRHGLETRALVVGFPPVEKKETSHESVEVDGLEIVRSCEVVRTPRVQQLEGIFDVPPSQRAEQRWVVDLKLDRPWNIGLIVGPSGSGKSTVASELFGAKLVAGWDWPDNGAIVDGFPAGMSIVEVTGLLSSVGFSSPPSWLKPFRVLSCGEQFRVNLARTFAEQRGLVAVDEFTSVVDRTVAQVGSAAVAKAIRASGRQFVAVSCHMDIEQWLQPDWKLEMPAATLTWRLLRRRPEIPLCIRRVDASAWEVFCHHHYLNHALNRSAACFMATVNERPAAFTAVLHNPHASGGYWREHRTVCLPDFQGVGIGNAMSEYIASLFVCKGKSYRSTTSHPAMIRHRLRSPLWVCTRVPSFAAPQKAGRKRSKKKAGIAADNAVHRLTASFEFIGSGREEAARDFGVID